MANIRYNVNESFSDKKEYITQIEHGPRTARRPGGGRKLGRIRVMRFSFWVLLLALLSFGYLLVFGVRFMFYGKIEDEPLSLSALQSEPSIKQVMRQPSPKHRKKHFPCEVELTASVDLSEPKDYMNFTKFSLQYVDRESKPLGNDLFEPRFGGHQTLEEREKSFHAKDQIVHCGFVKGPEGYQSSGFDLDDKDRAYMNTCVFVVSSCIFGSSDFLRRPTSKKISDYSKKNVCFVMFVDAQTLVKLSSEGHIPDDRGYIGLWRIIVVKNLPYDDMRKTGKVPKFLSHRLFPSSRYSIWLDSKLRLHTDPILIIEYFLWRTRSEYAISNHYDRHCVWEEVQQNKRLNKYNHSAIDEQFTLYQSDGLSKFDPSDPNNPLPSCACSLAFSLTHSRDRVFFAYLLEKCASNCFSFFADVPEGSFIVRAHTPNSNLFSCLWFNEVNRFTSRDQLSFAYTFLKFKRMNPEKPFVLNMFKDCERRALTKLFQHRAIPSPPPPA